METTATTTVASCCFLLTNFHHTNCFRTDEFGIDGLISNIANLLLGPKYLGEGSHLEWLAIDNPEVTKITEGDGSGSHSGRSGWHIVRNVHLLAENGVVAVVPEIAAIYIGHAAELECPFRCS